MLNVLRQMHVPIGKKPTMPLKDGVILPAPHAPENLTKFAISTHEADPRQRSTTPDLRDPRRILDAVTRRQVERFEPPSANRHPFGSLTTLAATRGHNGAAQHGDLTMKAYRYLTGKDDAAFCHRVTEALNNGWQLYGQPTLTFDQKRGEVICGQAITKELKGKRYHPELNLSTL